MRDDFHLRARLSPAVSSIQAGAPLSDASSLFVIGRAGRHRRSVWSRPPENPSPPPQSPWVARTCSSWRSTPTTRCTTPSARAPRTRTARFRRRRARSAATPSPWRLATFGAPARARASPASSTRAKPSATARWSSAPLPIPPRVAFDRTTPPSCASTSPPSPAARPARRPRPDTDTHRDALTPKDETASPRVERGAALLNQHDAPRLERGTRRGRRRATTPAEYLTKQRRDDDDGPVVSPRTSRSETTGGASASARRTRRNGGVTRNAQAAEADARGGGGERGEAPSRGGEAASGGVGEATAPRRVGVRNSLGRRKTETTTRCAAPRGIVRGGGLIVIRRRRGGFDGVPGARRARRTMRDGIPGP